MASRPLRGPPIAATLAAMNGKSTPHHAPFLPARVRRRMARKCPVCSNDSWYLKRGLGRLAAPSGGERRAAVATAVALLLAAGIALAPTVRMLLAA